jgi:hypothetical protein
MRSVQRLRCGDSGGDGERRKKTKGAVNAGPRRSIYKGTIGSAYCDSFPSKELTPMALC